MALKIGTTFGPSFEKDFRSDFSGGPGSILPSGSEPPVGSPVVPGIPNSALTTLTLGDIGRGIDIGIDVLFGPRGEGQCPGAGSVRVAGRCVNIGDILPGGDPAVTGQVNGVPVGRVEGFGQPVAGLFGVGITPRVDVQTVRRCPAGTALGKDGICYTGLSRNSPKRLHPMGLKPLLTGGDRMAIRKAGAAARKLERAKKTLRKAAKALDKVC